MPAQARAAQRLLLQQEQTILEHLRPVARSPVAADPVEEVPDRERRAQRKAALRKRNFLFLGAAM